MAIILSFVLAVAAMLPILQGANGQSCTLEQYGLNVDALLLNGTGGAWLATITNEGCIGEPKTGSGDICVIYFTVCDALPEKICNATDSGMCQRIQDSSDPPVVAEKYELGKATNEFNVTGKEGFIIDYETNITNPKCNGTNHTTIVTTEFRCSTDAVWSSNRLDVSKYLVEFTTIPELPCIYTAVFNYSGACIQAVPVEPKICNLPHYNISSLKDQKYWTIELSGNMCYDPSYNHSSVSAAQETTCRIHVSFCDVLPNIFCPDSMFCELTTGDTYPFSFGQFNHNLQYEENANGDGFVGNLFDGTPTALCPNGLTATVNFVCDKSAVWNGQDITQYAVASPEYESCQFRLTVQYSGACGTPFTPTSPTPAPGDLASPVGWILMGLFVAAVLAYFLIGSLVQLARGRRGVEVIPNYEFWKQFPILVVGGFKFVVDKITCYSIKNIGSSSKVTEYDKL